MSGYFIFVFFLNAVWALTRSGFRIVSDTLVEQRVCYGQTYAATSATRCATAHLVAVLLRTVPSVRLVLSSTAVQLTAQSVHVDLDRLLLA